MVLSQVSNQEALLALLFIETAWWGTNYIGNLVPSYISLLPLVPSTVMEWAVVGATGGMSTLRFLTVGIFWLALFEKHVGAMKNKLQVWYFTGLVLDIVILVIMTLLSISRGEFGSDLGPLSILIILRAVFWIFGAFILRDVNDPDVEPDEGPCQPSGIRRWTGSLERAFLLWEVFWYPVIILGGLQSLLLSSPVMTPLHNVSLWETLVVYLSLVIAAYVMLAGFQREWKLFLKFWILIYIALALLYCWVNVLELYESFYDGQDPRLTRIGVQVNLGIGVTFVLIPSVLRFITIIRTLQFAYSRVTKTDNDPEEDMEEVFPPPDFEKQPLINSLVALPPLEEPAAAMIQTSQE